VKNVANGTITKNPKIKYVKKQNEASIPFSIIKPKKANEIIQLKYKISPPKPLSSDLALF